MKPTLNTFQKAYSHHRLMFGTEFLSSDVAESLRRASLACAENQRGQTGIIDFFCGLYLQNRKEIAPYFTGDFAAVVTRNFPVHRFGPQGLVPQVMLDQITSEGDSCSSGFGFSLNYSDELQRLLWLSARLANSIGKKASVKDIVAAFTLNDDWISELAENGLSLDNNLPDFVAEVETVIFHATPHTAEGWPKEVEFAHDGSHEPPFTLQVTTPSGPFQPVRSAKVKLNGSEVGCVRWPEMSTVLVKVNLLTSNKMEFELDGPAFGSVQVTVRGTGSREWEISANRPSPD